MPTRQGKRFHLLFRALTPPHLAVCVFIQAWLGDCSEALDDSALHISADKLYKSSYFYIEGHFYDDLRDSACVRLSE